LPDASDLPHVISAKIWGCEGIIGYDEHFRSTNEILEYKMPEEIVELGENKKK
jgi:hypothetical protein